LDFRGAALSRFVRETAISTEEISGIPPHVSADMVFPFALFGVLLKETETGDSLSIWLSV